MGYFERHQFLDKTAVDTFWATFRRNWATFYSAIWSNWPTSYFLLTYVGDPQSYLNEEGRRSAFEAPSK